MAEWLLTIWFTIIPTDTMEPKEFSFTTSISKILRLLDFNLKSS